MVILYNTDVMQHCRINCCLWRKNYCLKKRNLVESVFNVCVTSLVSSLRSLTMSMIGACKVNLKDFRSREDAVTDFWDICCKLSGVSYSLDKCLWRCHKCSSEVFEIEHTRHQSALNALVHILSTLVAYSFKQAKQAMKMV